MPRKKKIANGSRFLVSFRLKDVKPRKHKTVILAPNPVVAEDVLINACTVLGFSVDVRKTKAISTEA